MITKNRVYTQKAISICCLHSGPVSLQDGLRREVEADDLAAE